MDDYKQDRIRRLLKLAMWMNAKADSKGKTHGEKHHWLFVMQQVLEETLLEVDVNDWRSQSMDTTPLESNDIPF